MGPGSAAESGQGGAGPAASSDTGGSLTGSYGSAAGSVAGGAAGSVAGGAAGSVAGGGGQMSSPSAGAAGNDANAGTAGAPVDTTQYFDPTDPTNWTELDQHTLPNTSTQPMYSDTYLYDGAAFDGRYVYFAPGPNQSDQQLLRYDTNQPFEVTSSWGRMGTGVNDGGGQRGAAFAGGYVYLAPFHGDDHPGQTSTVRLTSAEFGARPEKYSIVGGSPAAVTGVGEFAGVVSDGRYLTFVPGSAAFPRLARYDMTLPFADSGSWEFSPVGLPQKGPYMGGVSDGRYVYFSSTASSNILRIDPKLPLSDPTAYQYHDVLEPFSGAVFDGHYIYFQPSYGTSLWRFDTQQDFAANSSFKEIPILRPAGWGSLELSRPGAFDGRYLYLIDQYEIVQLDTRADPFLAASWRTQGLDPASQRCSYETFVSCAPSSAFDGEYLYIANGYHIQRLHARSPKLPGAVPNAGSFF